MTDRFLRQAIIVSATLALIMVLFDAPSMLRTPFVLGFVLIAPGLAVTRFIPTVTGVDRLGLAAATSLAMNVLASLLLVALDQWRGAPVLLLLVAVSILLAVIPSQSPWQRDRVEQARRRNEEIRERKRAQERAYEWVRSESVDERREGLLALAYLLDDDDRLAEAARLRLLARLGTPPRLSLGDHSMADAELQLVHKRARSEDPETRRQGLFEVAELLDGSAHDEAETLRDLAQRGDV